MESTSALAAIFKDPSYAWDLLECEIAIEMREVVDGVDIARLLELYMRGVEKMNSLLDVRESYFKNKVTALMGRSNVIKSFNKPPPMAKKKKPLELQAKNGKKNEQQKPIEQTLAAKPAMSNVGLLEKKKQIQLRLAYGAEDHSPQALRKMLAQQREKQAKITDKIEGVMKSHEERLNERIQKRKLKTSTFRSRPQETLDSLAGRDNQAKKLEEQFIPSAQKQNKNASSRPYKSLEAKALSRILDQSQSPKRVRKLTFDITPAEKS